MSNIEPEQITSDDKLWAGLSYAGLMIFMIPTIVIFLLKREESEYIKFHGLQALGFALAGLVIQVVLWTAASIPIIGLIPGLISILVSIASTGLWVYLMIVSFMGKHIKLPFLGDFIEQNLMG